MKNINKILILAIVLCIALAITDTYIKQESTTGEITFHSSPSGAQVWLGGDYYGVTQLYLEDVNPGTYSVVFKLSGYEDYTTSITVEAERIYMVPATLVKVD